MKKYRSEGITERTKLIYDLGLQNDYFNITESNKDVAIRNCKECIDYFNTHNHYPYASSNDKYISKLNTWLHGMKKAKQGKKSRIFYPILDQMAINAGLPDMFNLIDRKENAIQMLYKLIKFKQQLGIMPSVYANNSDEKQIAKWISHMRTAKKGGSPNKFYSELDDIAISHGLPNIFNSNWKDDLK